MILKVEMLLDVINSRIENEEIHKIVAGNLDMIIKDRMNYVKIILLEVYEPEIITRRKE